MIKENNKNIYVFLLIYIILLFFSGFYFFEYSTTYAIIFTLIFIFLGYKKQTSIKKITVKMYLLMVSCIIVSELLNALIYGQFAIDILLLIFTIVKLLIPLLFSNLVTIEQFKKKYCNCITVICICSLITYFSFIYFPSVIMKLPKLVNSNGNYGYFAIFSTVSNFINSGAHRNQGIFWEPGAFQVYICIALMFEIMKKSNISWIRILIYIAAIVTTYSTTGIICMILILIIKYLEGKNYKKVFKFFTVIIVAILCLYFIIPKLSGFWKYTLVSKFDMIYNYNTNDKNNVSSRIESIYVPLKEFVKSPMIGIGTHGYNKISQEVNHSMFTCTPINIFVKYGAIYGTLILTGLFNFFKQSAQNKTQGILFVAIYMLSTSTEALQNDIILLTMAMMGHLIVAERKVTNSESYIN